MAKSKKNTRKNGTVATNASDGKDKLNWKYWLIGLLVVVAAVGLVVGIALLANRYDYVKFTLSDGTLTREDGTVFLQAQDTYAVRYTIGNRYGMAGDTPIYKVGFYNSYGLLREMDEDNYLTDGKGTLYYGNYGTPPSLKEFSDTTDLLYICTDFSEDTLVAVASLSEADAQGAVKEYLNGERYQEPSDVEYKDVYTVQLTSTKYDYLYYIMYLVRCSNGDYYMYTHEDRSSIKVSASWFKALEPYEEEMPSTEAKGS